MAKIKIYGDIDSASIFFLNSTVDPKPMGTIIASLKSDEDRIVIQRTDRFEEDGVTFRTIFKRMNPSRICNKQGEELVDQLGYTTQQVIDYINEQSNLSPNTSGGDGSGTDLIGQSVCFSLDATSTSILLDNGQHFGVNTIKAVENGGNIDIVSIDSNETITHFTNLEVGNACVNGAVVNGGLNDVINTLNELFTVGAFTSVVITDPDATTIADVNGETDLGTAEGNNAIDPLGDDILGTTATHNNAAGYLSDNVIDQAGEYFTFDIAGKATYGFGLVHTQESYDAGYYSGNATYADPSNFCVGANSSHLGYQFSHHFHIGNAHASWTNYGANTAYNMGEAWYDHNNRFDLKEEWNNGDPVKVQVGINTLGFITISTLADDGVNWRLHARSSYPVPQGSSFRLGIKLQTTGARLRTQPKVHLLEPAAPTMYFRYIESPDGNFQYPLFATEEEANYYDTIEGGSGTSHTHVYVDDPTNTTWYMPDTNSTMTATVMPTNAQTFEGNAINWTEITSLTNSDLIPAAFTDTTITVDELSTVNYQLSPVDVGYTTSIGGIPAWSLINGTTLFGTAPEVTGDNVANPSDTTTVTVYRTNSYGTSQGTLTINITNLTAPAVTPINGVTHEGGTTLIDSDTMADGSVISIDNVVNNGNRFVIDKEWLDNYVLPKITSGSGTKSVWIGFETQGVTADYTAITNADFKVAYQFYCDDSSRANNNWRLKTHIQGSSFANVGIGGLTSGLYDYVFINEGSTLRAGALVASQGHNASTKVFDANSSDWNWTLYDSSSVGSQKIIIATDGTDLDLDLQYFNEYTEPTAPSILTNWNKALDFSGSSERAQQVVNDFYRVPMKMGNSSSTVSAPTAGQTVSSGHPWATVVVFKADTTNSNQHIWNLGEGSGSTDDNIYLRRDANRNIWFGWGRSGEINECYLTSISNAMSSWHGIYIGFNGTRLGSGHSAADIAACFDIRYTNSSSSWAAPVNISNETNWTTGGFGGRMNRQFTGYMTIGGRGANRSFHGKIASFVSTTLRVGVAMPTTTEIEMMITDPVKWLNDYKVGVELRLPWHNVNSGFNFSLNDGSSAYTAQVWLMGDGTNDSYSNMIRNQVQPNDQNYTKLNLISMVSNDIQNVNISGLS
ncbi:MAG: hypothetical protein GOVbin4342_40 [Prokaryotic dsDNA virus sp.]|nr:MAG: hypothetical protein GOVbin4342_40 [Prokaryotic dsDNA virus sp.]|tara:strand:+ start:4400 stop:7789 length:3390 start_codon:yes stop_codon:yes gene_type:complete